MSAGNRFDPAAPAEVLADEVAEAWRRVILANELHSTEGRRILGTALAVAHAALYANGCWGPEVRALACAATLIPEAER